MDPQELDVYLRSLEPHRKGAFASEMAEISTALRDFTLPAAPFPKSYNLDARQCDALASVMMLSEFLLQQCRKQADFAAFLLFRLGRCVEPPREKEEGLTSEFVNEHIAYLDPDRR